MRVSRNRWSLWIYSFSASVNHVIGTIYTTKPRYNVPRLLRSLKYNLPSDITYYFRRPNLFLYWKQTRIQRTFCYNFLHGRTEECWNVTEWRCSEVGLYLVRHLCCKHFYFTCWTYALNWLILSNVIPGPILWMTYDAPVRVGCVVSIILTIVADCDRPHGSWETRWQNGGGRNHCTTT